MAITLPVNKFLGALSNLISVVQLADTFSGSGVGRLLAACQDTNLDMGGVKVVNSCDVMAVEDYAEDRSPWEIKKPTVDQQAVEVTNYKVIPLSLSQYLTKGAFLSTTSMAEFMGYVRSIMDRSKEIFLYKALIAKMEGYVPKQTTQTVTVNLKNVPAAATSDEKLKIAQFNANAIATSLIKTVRQFDAPTTKYNDLGYTEVIDPKSMKLVINTDYDTDILVNTFATLFHSEKIADRFDWGETLDVPSDQLNAANKANEIGWLFGRGKFQYGYFYDIATSIFNPANLTDQNFVHFAYYLDTINALPCIKFVAAYSD